MRRGLIRSIVVVGITAAIVMCWPEVASAHGVSNRDAAFVRTVTGAMPAPFMYLGAKHMVTGYDHLLFLVGVIFFLYRTVDVVKFVSLFTLGHSLTLMIGVLANLSSRTEAYDSGTR